jgi:hypothetical protein
MLPLRQHFKKCQCSRPAESLSLAKVLTSGANPTIASYNASAVNIYNATCCLVRFENKNIVLHIEKTLYPTSTLALYLVVDSTVAGLGPGANPTTSEFTYNNIKASVVVG